MGELAFLFVFGFGFNYYMKAGERQGVIYYPGNGRRWSRPGGKCPRALGSSSPKGITVWGGWEGGRGARGAPLVLSWEMGLLRGLLFLNLMELLSSH